METTKISVLLSTSESTSPEDRSCSIWPVLMYLGVVSHEYLSKLEILPQAVADLAPSVKISYIGTVQPSDHQLVDLTSDLRVATTHHLSDPAVAPGNSTLSSCRVRTPRYV